MIHNKAALLDVNVFGQEGFTNGIFLTIKEIFSRLENDDIPSAILSISHAATTKEWDGMTFGRKSRKVNDIKVEEMLIEKSIDDNQKVYVSAMEDLIQEYKPTLIFMYTPAVFFNEIHILSLQKAIDSGAKVVVILADSLYPTSTNHPGKNIEKYYDLLKKTEVISTSKVLIQKFMKDVGILAKYFPNIFSPNQISAKPGKKEYITLVNHHPIKGIEIFNNIALKMPDKKFFVVETWPDVPDYVPPSSNITFSKFIPDVRELYAKTKIIIIPSLYEEGPSRLMIEGMLNKIPVIAHDIGCLSEVGAEFAIFVDPPVIEKSEMIGTIIYPRLKKEELDKVVDRFIKIIRKIDVDSTSLQEQSIGAYSKAIQYCNNVEAIFLDFKNEWFNL